jgi:hypothetical protein
MEKVMIQVDFLLDFVQQFVEKARAPISQKLSKKKALNLTKKAYDLLINSLPNNPINNSALITKS